MVWNWLRVRFSTDVTKKDQQLLLKFKILWEEISEEAILSIKWKVQSNRWPIRFQGKARALLLQWYTKQKKGRFLDLSVKICWKKHSCFSFLSSLKSIKVQIMKSNSSFQKLNPKKLNQSNLVQETYITGIMSLSCHSLTQLRLPQTQLQWDKFTSKI